MMLMRMRMRDERGVAMVVALLVSFVLLILATAIVAQSIHNVDSSAQDRRRLQSINAAEAGNNYYYAYLQSTTVTSLSCDPVTQTIASAPATASFTATPTFFDNSDPPVPMSCPFTSTNYPSAVSIQTTGTVSGQTPRTMQTYIRLNPVYGGFGAAILVNTTASFVNNFDIYGDTSYDGDIYVLNGDFTIGNSGHVRGNVYVPNGSATMANNAVIEGDLWANGNITMSNTTRVNGNAISSTGSISGSNSPTVSLNATAATTISGVAVGGTQYPNTVSPQPPTQTFPQIGYVQTDWTNAGYTNIQTFSGSGSTPCTDAYNYITGPFSSTPSIGKTVVRITGVTGGCTLTFANTTNVTVNANLAIITDYGITMVNQTNWNGSGTVKDVHFISTWPAPTPCPSGTASKSIITSNNTSMNEFVHAFFYSPCTVTMANSSNWYGQVVGGYVNIANNFDMTYQPVLVPGAGQVESFTEDIAYVREVANP